MFLGFLKLLLLLLWECVLNIPQKKKKKKPADLKMPEDSIFIELDYD